MAALLRHIVWTANYAPKPNSGNCPTRLWFHKETTLLVLWFHRATSSVSRHYGLHYYYVRILLSAYCLLHPAGNLFLFQVYPSPIWPSLHHWLRRSISFYPHNTPLGSPTEHPMELSSPISHRPLALLITIMVLKNPCSLSYRVVNVLLNGLLCCQRHLPL